MARRPNKQFFKYECTLTGETFTRTAKAKDVQDLLSVNAYYELNPEEDDRAEGTKKLSKITLKQEVKEEEIEISESLNEDEL